MGSKSYLFAYAAGVFTIAAAILDWDWFFKSSKARFFVDALGRNGARMFYGVLGVVILFLGSRLGG
jgi:hypothetical protein